MIICAACSIITVLFGFIGIYITLKSHQNCFNQYIESILSVHEHIHDRLSTKYEKQCIKWKLFVHYKDTKRVSIFGRKQDITYYGIIIQIINNNDSTDNENNNQFYNVYNIDDTSDTTNDEYATTSDDNDNDDDYYNNTKPKRKQIQIQSSSNLQHNDIIEFDPEISHSKMAKVHLMINNDEQVPFIGTHIKLTN
eukprot:76742_1